MVASTTCPNGLSVEFVPLHFNFYFGDLGVAVASVASTIRCPRSGLGEFYSTAAWNRKCPDLCSHVDPDKNKSLEHEGYYGILDILPTEC